MQHLEQYQTLTITWCMQFADNMSICQGDLFKLGVTVMHRQCGEDCPASEFMTLKKIRRHLLLYACSPEPKPK